MSGTGQSPKVIHVSFGAFSCTVEGFEDPVGTLLAVTEHFRTLAASDPQFAGGAGVPDRVALERAIEGAGPGEVRVRWADGPELRVQAQGLSRDPGPGSQASGNGAPEDGPPGAAEGQEAGRSVLGRLAGALRALPQTLAAGPLAEGPEAPAEPRQAAEPARAGPASPAEKRAEGAAAEAVHDDPGTEGPRVRAWEEWVGTDADWPGDEEDWPEGDAGEAWPPRRFALPAPEGGPAAPPEPGAEPVGGRRLLAVSPDQDEATLQRFLSRTERQLADPGTAQRHAAMGHLKAAVAAARARRALDGDEPDDLEVFREEWAAAARPLGWRERALRRRRADLRRTAFPEAERHPGGLAEPPAAFEPVAGPEGAQGASPLDREAAHSFPRFAEAAGAVGLSDLLEAAATWVSVVRGEEAVSRADLLTLAAEALPEPPRREEALRVFGTLLRQGRLSRVEGGGFRLGEGTRFRPD